MKTYETANIRNVAIVGHGGSGKTSLTSAMLFDAGAVNRLGRVEEGNTVTDFDADEIARQISLATAVAHCEWNKCKLNLLDAPGYGNFIQEARVAVHVADSALVNVCGVAGVEVQTEKVWQFAAEEEKPRILVVNRLDRDRSSFARALESIQKVFGREAIPIALPVGEEKDFRGVVDLITMKAFIATGDEKGTHDEQEIPLDLKEAAEAGAERSRGDGRRGRRRAHGEVFRRGRAHSARRSSTGLKAAIRGGKYLPVLATSGVKNIGVQHVMTALIELAPSPDAQGAVTGTGRLGQRSQPPSLGRRAGVSLHLQDDRGPVRGADHPAPRHERRAEIGLVVPEHAQERHLSASEACRYSRARRRRR